MAYITESTKLARRHMKKLNKGNHIFNDRLVDGRRSVKVPGWRLPEYQSFQQVLKSAGFESEIVDLPEYRNVRRNRIHITEK